ncbi:chemotaxis protein CheW [Variovorax sp. ZT4R33]|uniref:chemotaxis protein CheW n=1 Tax=Variovorax sp. ZT4R33 TaxID=3443743 RepID=UPI003F45DF7D
MRAAFPATHASRPGQHAVALLPSECLAFRLDERAYGIDMRQVQELRGYGAVASLGCPTPQRQRWLELRGAMVPCIDLRRALALPVADKTPTVVVVAALDARLLCFTADGVLGVRWSDPMQHPSSADALTLDLRTTDDDTLRLLHLDRILAADAFDAFTTVPDTDRSLAGAHAARSGEGPVQWRATDNRPSMA